MRLTVINCRNDCGSNTKRRLNIHIFQTQNDLCAPYTAGRVCMYLSLRLRMENKFNLRFVLSNTRTDTTNELRVRFTYLPFYRNKTNISYNLYCVLKTKNRRDFECSSPIFKCRTKTFSSPIAFEPETIITKTVRTKTIVDRPLYRSTIF